MDEKQRLELLSREIADKKERSRASFMAARRMSRTTALSVCITAFIVLGISGTLSLLAGNKGQGTALVAIGVAALIGSVTFFAVSSGRDEELWQREMDASDVPLGEEEEE